ncbi:MAG: DUF4417 domain-containing protein [Clostridia bacterium]|nr:DUF4417 domain-containing protein [Clostridia bacterium]
MNPDYKLKIEYLPLSALKPYERNVRKHEKEDVVAIADSIRKFGFDDTIDIWGEENVIVCGHGRYLAAQQLGMTEVPCVRLDHLTDEERRAYMIAHNRTAELSRWDAKNLKLEMQSFAPKISLPSFQFKLNHQGKAVAEQQHAQNREETQTAKENILNLARAQYDGVGPYDIPEILPVHQLPEIREWIGFNYVLSDKSTPAEKAHKGVHFFIDDYQFERLWNAPDNYMEKLAQYGCVLSPDFSPYGDMPLATQIYNHYRKHWVAAYMQDYGITVVPTIRASTDPRSFAWYLDGEPHHSIVAISTMWVKEGTDIFSVFEREYQTMMDTLHPQKLLIYGDIPSNVQFPEIERIPKFTEKRWNK